MAGAGLPPPSTESLRRAALARSQRRGEQVARRRLAWRWTVWALGRTLRLVLAPMLLLGGLAGLAWWLWADGAILMPAAAPSPEPAAVAVQPAAAPPKPVLPLRLDDGEADPATAAGRAQSDTTLPNADHRSSQ